MSLPKQLLESKLITDEQWKEYQELKEKNKRAIRRISIVRMDEDTTIETHKALDFILQALIGDSNEDSEQIK